MPRQALAVQLIKIIEDMGEVVPSEETVIKLISEARNQYPKPLDKPWSLASLLEHPVSSDALLAILSARVAQDACESHKPIGSQRPLTIRQALWADKLHCLFKDTASLLYWALEYAQVERFDEFAGQPFDSSNIDRNLIYSLREDISRVVDMTPEQIGLGPIDEIVVCGPGGEIIERSVIKRRSL